MELKYLLQSIKIKPPRGKKLLTMNQITKQYEASPSKNHTEEKGLSLEAAKAALDLTQRLWAKNGGEVISRTENELICAEADGSETFTWTIEEH